MYNSQSRRQNALRRQHPKVGERKYNIFIASIFLKTKKVFTKCSFSYIDKPMSLVLLYTLTTVDAYPFMKQQKLPTIIFPPNDFPLDIVLLRFS